MAHFHIGKVLKVIKPAKDVLSADPCVQAIVEMWDQNQIVLSVEHAIASQLQESDIVIVDYSPIEGFPQPVPKQTIVKVLRGRQGKSCWELFKKYFGERNKKMKQREVLEQPGIPYSR
jgi:hypothetical protein